MSFLLGPENLFLLFNDVFFHLMLSDLEQGKRNEGSTYIYFRASAEIKDENLFKRRFLSAFKTS